MTLARLQELPPPEAPSWWWPPAPGWWWLLGSLALAGGIWMWLRWRRHWKNRYRRRALARVSAIEAALTQGQRTQAMAVELVATLRAAADTVAGRRVNLVGAEWCAFLDQRLAQPYFASSVGESPLGRLLCEAPYRPLSFDEMARLAGAIRHWLEHHRVAV